MNHHKRVPAPAPLSSATGHSQLQAYRCAAHDALHCCMGPAPQAIYAMGWEEDGRNKQAAIADRLVMLCQTAAKQFTSVRHDDLTASQPLHVFESAMVHLARITRVLSMEQGHMVLLGPAACGKRSLARLAAYMCGCTTVEAKLKDTQKGFSWRDAIKSALLAAGVQGRWARRSTMPHHATPHRPMAAVLAASDHHGSKPEGFASSSHRC